MKDFSKHPCFNVEAKHKYARVHLPVAPKCNIQCNYCNRKYDCCNESRPGVTSAILSPIQAVHYLKKLNEEIPNMSVIGIAGPGDPFANPIETISTMKIVKQEFPDMIFCLSTNGLNLAPYIDEIAEIGVSHVTITLNSLNISTLGKIYRWVCYDKKIYYGEEGGRILLEQQLKCIQQLKDKGIIVKINTVICPGINDIEVEEIAKKVASLGADTMNCIPMYPTKDTAFGLLEEPSKKMMKQIKEKITKYIKPMAHCARCRADAAGLLGHDNLKAMNAIGQYSFTVMSKDSERTRVAVATNEGSLVNLHLGEASKVYVFEQSHNGYHLVDIRNTPPEGGGMRRWEALAQNTLHDCQAILVSGIGFTPMRILQKSGIKVIQMNGLIDVGLDAVYHDTSLLSLYKKEHTVCGESCKGNQKGCV